MKKYLGKFLLLLTICTLPVFLLSCLIPEKFDVKIIINKDKTFSFVYDGILTFVLARGAAVEGSLSAKDEKELQAMGDQELKRDKNFKKFKYLGKGRYEVFYKKEGELKRKESFFDFIHIIPLKENKVEIRSIKLSKDDIMQFEALKMKIDGTVEVKTDGNILEQNGKKSFWGSGYKWRIKSVKDPAPYMLIQAR
ncbi:MAG: hypothetical protein DDT19_02250 [Syntrophomonadaceae bacterium]|nr:hypothetical protein [Bacillota bacterium]